MQTRLIQTQQQKAILSQRQHQALQVLQWTNAQLSSAVTQALDENPLLRDDSTEMAIHHETTEIVDGLNSDPTPPKAVLSSLTDTADAPFDSDTQHTPTSAEAEPMVYLSTNDSNTRPEGIPDTGVTPDFSRTEDSALWSWKSSTRRLEDESDPFDSLSQFETLTRHLKNQLPPLQLDAATRLRVDWLIDNLDDDGMIRDYDEVIAVPHSSDLPKAITTATEDDWAYALDLVQSLDPAGVGARSYLELLRLQLEDLRFESVAKNQIIALALDIIALGQTALMQRDRKQLAKALNKSLEEIQAAFALLAELDPHPTAAFAHPEETGVVIPDLVAYKNQHGQWIVNLNPETTYRLHFDEATFAMMTEAKLAAQDLSIWKNKAQQAKHFVYAVESRYSTLLAVAKVMVEMQGAFLDHGLSHLKPMTLSDIASRLNMANSTISRAIAGKYITTTRGTFELKSFFARALPKNATLTTETSSEEPLMTAQAIINAIKTIVAQENCQQPMSDTAIGQALNDRGIKIARRTVAKYREQAGIAPKHLRKQP